MKHTSFDVNTRSCDVGAIN